MKEVTKFEKVLIVAMLLAMTFLLTASSQTEASGLPFGTQIGEYNKIIAYSNYDINYASGEYNYINSYNTGMKWHCVEYINRYYYITYGMEIRIPGTNAEDYYDTASERELGAYPNGGTVRPQPGDILCSNGGDYGHVAIIREVTDDAIHVIHQNWTNTEADNDKIIDMSVSDGHFTVSGFTPSYPVQGWLRKLPTPRGWLAAAVIGNIIYSIGGGTCEGIECGMFGGNETSVVEAYDPSTNVWTVKPPLDIARFGLTTSEVNGKIYAIGGTSGCCSQPVSSVEEYDLNSDTWSLKTTMPTPRWKLTSSVVDGRIYTIGGGATGNQCSPTGTVEEYDPVNDMWATKNPMPTPRWGADSVVINGQIYVVGGSSACPHIIVEPSSALEVYDPFTDTWTVKTPMPTARWDLAAAVVNEKIYAIGGWDPQSESPLQTVEEYDPDTNTWATKSPMPTARTGVVAPAINGRIYAFGGFDGSKVTNILEVYDPISDTWSQATCPFVTTTVVSSITSNSASSGGNVTSNGGASVTARGVCWSTSANPTISDSHTSDGTGTGSFTSSITGLSPNTTYHVRAYATNSEGTAYGSNEMFSTNCSGDVVVLESVTFYSGTTYECVGTTSITIGTGVTVQSGATVTFTAPTVKLQPGFHAESGAVVRIKQP